MNDNSSGNTRNESRQVEQRMRDQKEQERKVLTTEDVKNLLPNLTQMPDRIVTDHGTFDVIEVQ